MRIACVDHARHADRLEDHERAHAVDLAPRLDRRRLARIDDDVGAQLLGQLPRFGEKSAATIGPMPRIFSSAMHASPTGPEPEHDRRLAAGDAALGDGVHADGERLGQRGQVGRQAARAP